MDYVEFMDNLLRLLHTDTGDHTEADPMTASDIPPLQGCLSGRQSHLDCKSAPHRTPSPLVQGAAPFYEMYQVG